MPTVQILTYLCAGLFSLYAFAQEGPEQSPELLYQSGIQNFQKGEIQPARDAFKAAWQIEPNNKFILFNWGLSEYQLGNLGWAMGAWRRAINLDPRFTKARHAMEFLEETNSVGNLQGTEDQWENFRNRVLSYVGLNELVFFCALIFLFAGSFALRFLGQYKRAIQAQLPKPSPPAFVLSGTFLLLVGLGLLGAKAYDQLIPRGTIVEKEIEVKSAPNASSTTLFQLEEGSEVILKQSKDGWTQVKYPSGMTGWIPNPSLFPTAGVM